MSKPNTIKIDEVEYVRADSVQTPTGDYYIVVLDRGWIFHGRLTENECGGWRLDDAVNVRKWTSGGYGGLSRSAIESCATLDECDPVVFDECIFMTPTGDKWREK